MAGAFLGARLLFSALWGRKAGQVLRVSGHARGGDDLVVLERIRNSRGRGNQCQPASVQERQGRSSGGSPATTEDGCRIEPRADAVEIPGVFRMEKSRHRALGRDNS